MIRIALVGCGRIAHRHATLLGGGQIEGASLAAVCDRIPERAEAIGSQYGVPAYTDMEEMLQAEERNIDVVSVLTPSGLHADHVITLSKYRKHIVVEKPMALALDDADAMLSAVISNGIKLFVVKQNRLNVQVQRLRSALRSDEHT